MTHTSLAPQHGVEEFETFDYERPLSVLKALQNVSTQRQRNSLFRGVSSIHVCFSEIIKLLTANKYNIFNQIHILKDIWNFNNNSNNIKQGEKISKINLILRSIISYSCKGELYCRKKRRKK